LYFDLSTIPQTAKVNSAKLILTWMYQYRNKTTVIEVFRPQASWDVSYTTWNSKQKGVPWITPGGDWIDKNGVSYGTTPYAKATHTFGSTDNVNLDVTSLLQDYVEGKFTNAGFFLKANEIDETYLAFYGADWTNDFQRPKLVIEYDI